MAFAVRMAGGEAAEKCTTQVGDFVSARPPGWLNPSLYGGVLVLKLELALFYIDIE